MKQVREGYKMTELGEIPVEWDVEPLSNITEVIMGQSPDSTSYNDIGDGIPFYQGKTEFGSKYPIVKKWCNKPNKIAEKDDVLISVRAPVGEVNICADRSCIGRGLGALRSIEKKSFYLYIFYTIQYLKGKLELLGQGSTFSAINGSELRGLLIPTPNIIEQQKIAEILSTVDEQIENTEQLIEKTIELKKGLMQKLLTKGIGHTEFKQTELGEIPVKWDVEELDNIVEKITDGAHKTPRYTDSGVPFLRVSDIQAKEINWADTKYISHAEHAELIKRCNPQKGDILLSKNGTIGVVKLIDWDDEFSIFVSLCLIKLKSVNSLLDSKFLAYYISSDLAQKQFKDSSKQGTVTNLHLIEIKKVKIPILNISEQQKIAAILSSVDEQIESYEQEKEKYLQLKKGLMQQLLTGKMRVTV